MSIVLVFAVRMLEGMFIVGSMGCLVVLALTAIEDIRTFIGKDENAAHPLPPEPAHQ